MSWWSSDRDAKSDQREVQRREKELQRQQELDQRKQQREEAARKRKEQQQALRTQKEQERAEREHGRQQASSSVWAWGTNADTHDAHAEQETQPSMWGTLFGQGQHEPESDQDPLLGNLAKGKDHVLSKVDPHDLTATRTTRMCFAEEWQDGGYERFMDFKSEYYALPPKFRMPRLNFLPFRTQWRRAFEGPPDFMMPTCEQKLVKATRDSVKSADDVAEDAELKEEETKRREKKGQPGCIRQFGLQILMFAIWAGCAYYIFITYNKQYYRKINLLTVLMFNAIFTVAWLKAIWKVSGVLFVWLEATEEHVDEGGEVIAMFARRSILSRLFHLLIAEDEQIVALLAEHSPSMYDEEDAFEKCLGVMFVDDSDNLMRVCERQDDPQKPGYVLRDNQGKVHDISVQKNPHWEPWLRRGLRYCVDASSDFMDNIVKENKAWYKFENSLTHKQTVLNGYRGYLGPSCFDGRLRFIFFIGLGPPVSIMAGFFAYRAVMDTASPEVYLDETLMLKHFMVVLCVGIASNLLAVQANSFAFTMWVVNTCMAVIEAGVNRELLEIPKGETDGNSEDEETDDIEPIPSTWRKLRSEKTIKAIGEQVFKAVVESKTRQASFISRARLRGVSSAASSVGRSIYRTVMPGH